MIKTQVANYIRMSKELQSVASQQGYEIFLSHLAYVMDTAACLQGGVSG